MTTARTSAWSPGLILCYALATASPAPGADPVPGGKAAWEEILGPPRGEIPPPPPGKLEWLNGTKKALETAQRENRPVFVTFRCLPCKQCADFDRDVLDGGELLSPLLKRFVCVRLTNAEHIDTRIFPAEGFQDLDLSWWAYFLSPNGELYGIFGGRDDVSESTRISELALVRALERVLAHHHDPRRASWGIDGQVPDLSGKYPAPWDLPGWKSWEKGREAESGCLHCHELVEVMRQPAIDAKTFDMARDLELWPLPENVGLELERDHGLFVKEVKADSPAVRLGLRAGDVLGAAGGRRLFGQTDFRGVLHRGPRGSGVIPIVWRRGEELLRGDLQVALGWRRTLLDWRMSVSQGNIGASPGFFPNAAGDGDRKRLGIPAGKMAVRPFLGDKKGIAWNGGVRPGYVITSVDGESPDKTGRAFLVWFRLRHHPGDEIVLTALDEAGEKKVLKYKVGRTW